MHKLNDAPILDQMDGQTQKLLMIALWKAKGNEITKITDADISAFNEAHNGMAIMYLHGHKDSIDIGVVTPERAQQIAAHHESITPRTPQ